MKYISFINRLKLQYFTDHINHYTERIVKVKHRTNKPLGKRSRHKIFVVRLTVAYLELQRR